MTNLKRLAFILTGFLMISVSAQIIDAQTKPLTYPEINTALNTKLPNKSFKNKTALINWLITQIKQRKVDKPLTEDREEDLRQAGATNQLISAIKANSPALPDSSGLTSAYYIKRGNDFYEKSDYPNAIKEYTKALQLDPKNADIYFVRGYCNRQIGENLRAIADYTKAVEIAPNFSDAYYNRAWTYSEEGEYDKAVEDYTKAIKIAPNDGLAYGGRGFAYEMRGDLDLAIADYRKALDILPTHQKIKESLDRALEKKRNQ
jgi:tetratricopeptide (TPR) repeat protein